MMKLKSESLAQFFFLFVLAERLWSPIENWRTCGVNLQEALYVKDCFLDNFVLMFFSCLEFLGKVQKTTQSIFLVFHIFLNVCFGYVDDLVHPQ